MALHPNKAKTKAMIRLLNKHKINNANVNCRASGRVAICTLNGTAKSFDRLIAELNLQDEKREQTDCSYSCSSLEFFDDARSIKVYANLNRFYEFVDGKSMPLSDFYLYHRLDTDEACIHYTYPYG